MTNTDLTYRNIRKALIKDTDLCSAELHFTAFYLSQIEVHVDILSRRYLIPINRVKVKEKPVSMVLGIAARQCQSQSCRMNLQHEFLHHIFCCRSPSWRYFFNQLWAAFSFRISNEDNRRCCYHQKASNQPQNSQVDLQGMLFIV